MASVKERAREGVEVGLGLALLGVQRWMSLRPDVERELDRLGYTFAADVSRQLGDSVMRLVTELATGSSTAR